MSCESARDSLECAICLELLCEPLQLPCSHVFCRKCLTGAVRQNRSCALCRADIPEGFNPVVEALHKPSERILMRQCTLEYMARMDELAFEAARLVRLKISNTYEFLGFGMRNKHLWSLSVELESQPEACLPHGLELPKIIKHVRFGTLPAFTVLSPALQTSEKPPRYVEVSDGPFEVTATSPLSCTIPIVITWMDSLGQPPLRLEHQLDFNRDGGNWDYAVDLKEALNIASPEEQYSGDDDALPTFRLPAAEDYPSAPYTGATHWRHPIDLTVGRSHTPSQWRSQHKEPRRRRSSALLAAGKTYLRNLFLPRSTYRTEL